ncbi:hypothetical protein GBA52_025980 [Prunus armeniaca]|nr:hypothetical protein GBA52_025980 [Prunus armeniaca]
MARQAHAKETLKQMPKHHAIYPWQAKFLLHDWQAIPMAKRNSLVSLSASNSHGKQFPWRAKFSPIIQNSSISKHAFCQFLFPQDGEKSPDSSSMCSQEKTSLSQDISLYLFLQS